MADSSSIDLARIAIIGAGRLGSALAPALRRAGLNVAGPLGRGATGRDADIVILCVPDDAIAAAVRTVPPGPLVGHSSGSTTLAPLSPHEAFSLHPLLAIGSTDVGFTGAWCAVAGSTPRALGTANELASRLGMHPFEIADADRALYHAAASVASNYLVVLEGAAERLANLAGVEREALVPLSRAALEAWARHGAREALTGPIARGDEETVARQRAAVATRAPQLLPLWDALAEATRRLAAQPLATP